jgi:hypothetical protein
MITALFRAAFAAVFALGCIAGAAADDEEPLCNTCRTINATGAFDGNGCPTNFPMRPGSECYCLASINGQRYGIDGYACRMPAMPPVPPPPRREVFKKPNWERLSPELISRWLKWRQERANACSACYYTMGNIEKSCTTSEGARGGACLCYEEMPNKLLPLRVAGKLCQGADGSPR